MVHDGFWYFRPPWAGNTTPGCRANEVVFTDVCQHLIEVRWSNGRVGVDEREPVPARLLRTPVSGVADPSTGLSDDPRAVFVGDRNCVVLAFAVDHDEFEWNGRVECLEATERLRQSPLLVACRDHDAHEWIVDVTLPGTAWNHLVSITGSVWFMLWLAIESNSLQLSFAITERRTVLKPSRSNNLPPNGLHNLPASSNTCSARTNPSISESGMRMTAPEPRSVVDTSRIVQSVAWFLISLAVVSLVLYLIGIEEVLRTARRADGRAVVGLAVLAGGTVVARGVALVVLFEILGQPVSLSRGIALYVASTFLNNATPSGQAGGAPASGLLIARTGDAPYEVGFAAILTLGVCSNLVMLGFGVIGVGVVSATATTGTDLGLIALATVGLMLLMGFGIAALVRFHQSMTTAAVTVLTPLARVGGQILPRWSPPERSAVERRVERFWTSLERLRDTSPRQILAITVLLAAAHMMNIGALWVALGSVGASVAFSVLLAVVPTAAVAAVAPIPSGAGGVSVALIALLVATTSAGAPIIGTAVVLYRAVTHWFRTLVGGIVAAMLVGFGHLND